METPQLLELSKTTIPGVQPVKLLRLNEPMGEVVTEWKGAVSTLSDVFQARRLPNPNTEDQQCQATIQIDPLSDLVKKHYRETHQVPMLFSEIVDVTEADYAPGNRAITAKFASINTEKFNTKADNLSTVTQENPMKHYMETWEFQTKWMKERLKQCEQIAGNLEKEIQIQQEDFRQLAVKNHVIKQQKAVIESNEKAALQSEATRAEFLLRGNRELLAEVDSLLKRRNPPSEVSEIPVKSQEIARPEEEKQTVRLKPEVTARLKSAFNTAADAIKIAEQSKSLKTGRKLYRCKVSK